MNWGWRKRWRGRGRPTILQFQMSFRKVGIFGKGLDGITIDKISSQRVCVQESDERRTDEFCGLLSALTRGYKDS